MNRQEHYREVYARIKPGWQDGLRTYRDIVDHMLGPGQVLDVGCGHADFLTPTFSRAEQVFGIDPDLQALHRNTTIQHVTVGVAATLPFADASFDLVLAAWVLEHLDDPQCAFREIHRVLRKGGKIIFLTPNAWNYNVWIIRAIPHAFHDFLVRRLYNRQENDTYPVHYRINTVSSINRILGEAGFRKQQLRLIGDPSYISFNEPLFWLACQIERLLDTSWFQQAKVHLLGVYQK